MTNDYQQRHTAARERAAAWIDAQRFPSCALVWCSRDEPEVFRTWDLYSLDDYDFVAALPPGATTALHRWTESPQFGCYKVDEVRLPNGWTLAVGYHS